MAFTPGFAVDTAIKEDSVGEFEEWARSVLDLDELRGRWQLMRTDERRGNAVVSIVLLEGDDPDGWDMESALRRKYGPERAQAELAKFEGMIDGEQTLRRLIPMI